MHCIINKTTKPQLVLKPDRRIFNGIITSTTQLIQTYSQDGVPLLTKKDIATSEIMDFNFYICLRYSIHLNVPFHTTVLDIINYLMFQWHLARGQYIVHSFIVIRVTTLLHINSLSYLWINQHYCIFVPHFINTFIMADGGSSVIIPKDEVHSFVIRCMGAVGLKVKHSNVLADLITSADYRGHASHGLNKLGKITLLLFHFVHFWQIYLT